jgi:peptidyl-prolyl cis-trans isomerase C
MMARTTIMAIFLCILSAALLPAEEINPILGKAGDFIIREADLERMLSSQPPAVQKRFLDDPQQRFALVREILMKKAVVAKARKAGFDRKPEIKEQLSYVIDNYLAQEYLAKVITAGITVPEEDLKKYYQEHEKDFQQPEQVTVRHILIASLKDDRPEARERARARAEDIVLRLKKGEDFVKLASEFSDDQNSSQKGGELGTIAPGKTNSDEFEKAAFALTTGQISDIVSTSYGFHIIKQDGRKEKRTAPFSEVRDFILNTMKSELEQKKGQEFVELAAKDAGLEVFGETPAAAADKNDTKPSGITPEEVKK